MQRTEHGTGSGPERQTLGVIGVGEIASAMVDAVLTGPHADRWEVLLSPRSAERSSALERRHTHARVAVDNQAVVDGAHLVVLAVLPDQVDNCCAGLTFRERQVVVGLAAGWPPSRLAPAVAPAHRVCQLVPLPMIARHLGPIVLYPRLDEVAGLLDGCGTLIVPGDERDVTIFSAASAVMSSYLAAQLAVTEWTIGEGVAPNDAKQYVTSLLSGLAATSVAADAADLPALIGRHETPGGLNEQLRRTLTEAGLGDVLRQGLDALRARLR